MEASNCLRKPGHNSRINALESEKMPSKEEQLSDKHRIGFLNQCKLELSAEVIRWKEKSVKFQKENEAAVKQIDELQSYISKLSRKNHELETSLFLSWEENKRLRKRTLAIGEENSALHEKLSKSKYYSYPNLDLKNSFVGESSVNNPSQTLWHVSQCLFQQMQKEINEMQKLSSSFNENENVLVQSHGPVKSVKKQEDSLKEIDFPEAELDCVVLQTNELKQHLKVQSEKLNFLLDSISQEVELRQRKKTETKQLVLTTFAATSKDEERLHSKPSDETFRAYFTQQLIKNTTEEKKNSQVYLNQDSTNDISLRGSHMNLRAKTLPSNSIPAKELTKMDNKKLCPICKAAFPSTVPDKEFEAHVIIHLEAVSATLLDHYEVI